MDHRHLIAYFFLFLIVAGVAIAWYRGSSHWRGRRRASRAFQKQQRTRRADQE